ncbi:MAG: DUF4329 domain-containing protein [Bdellovibrionales bacterium]|nr:DUF4329 domain-containing protein [Bdellovibrionales bacterium]
MLKIFFIILVVGFSHFSHALDKSPRKSIGLNAIQINSSNLSGMVNDVYYTVDLGKSVYIQLQLNRLPEGNYLRVFDVTPSHHASNFRTIYTGGDSCVGNFFNGPYCTHYASFTPTATEVGDYVYPIIMTVQPWTVTPAGDYTPGTIQDIEFDVHINTKASAPETETCEKGSIVKVDSQTLGEVVPVAGTNFDLYYSTSMSSYFSSNRLPTNPYFRSDVFTISVQHFYDYAQSKLFLGTGSAVNAYSQLLPTGNRMVVSPSGDEVYIFDSLGKHLETKTFLTGATKYTFWYDSNSHLASIIDAFGKQTTFFRNTSGYLTGIQGPYGQTTSLVVNSSGLTTSITNPNSEIYYLTYKTGTDLLETFQKPGGQTSTFTYTADGRLTKDLGAGGNFWLLARDISTPNISVAKSSGLGRQSSYTIVADALGFTREEVTPFGLTNTYSESITESKVSNSIGGTRTDLMSDERFHSLYWRPSYSGKKMGSVESITYYGQTVNFPTGVTDPFGFTSIVRTANTRGRITTSTYTAATKTLNEVSHEGATATTVYNSYEQPVSQQTGSDTPWTFSYDADGRPSQLTQGSKNTLTYTYNTAGYVQSVTNALSEVTSYIYDLAGRVTQVTLPDTRVVSYSYDANGNLTSVTPPSKPAHNFTFNLFETLDTYSPPALSGLTNKNTTYAYNLDKQLTKITRPDLQEVNYNYNSTTGQISSIQLPTGSYTYTFKTNEDRIDNISSPDDFNSKFGYYGYKIASDALRKTSTNFLYGLTSFTYDADHRLSSRTVRGNLSTDTSTINYTYNNDDQLTTVGDMALTYEYPSGRLSTTSIGKITDSRTYDAYGNLQTYTATYTPTSGSPQTLYSYTFTRDALSRIATKTETIQGVTDVYAYSYDSAGRLTQVLKNTALYSSYTYDSNGNRTSGTTAGTAFTATYDDQDRLLTYNTRSYSYNANGDLTQIQWTPTTQSTYTYDAIGNLKQAVLTSGNNITYSYDGLNRRALKLDGTTLKFRYLYEDKYRVSAQVNNSGQILKAYVYATDINVADYMTVSGVTYRLIKDHLGSPRLVVNVSDGTVIQRMDYNDLGEAVADTNGGFQPFGFAGGLYDAQTKLVKFGARDYDARAAGRWTAKDPIRFSGDSANLYSYTFADPVNFMDIDGLKPGDKFKTAREAAQDAIKYVNDQSIREDIEYAGTVNINSDGTYSATDPQGGGKHKSDFMVDKEKCKAIYHTHGADSPGWDDENFSAKDKAEARRFKLPSYLGTPSGKIKVYKPNSR